MTREEARAVFEKLVSRFDEQRQHYLDADYNETKTRRDFIDPFFKALGWDIDNEQDVAEPYREVIHEDKLKIQGKVKSPDYGFRLLGAKQRLFFVEAKKPSVSLKTNKDAAYQVRRYGWNSKVPLSILTNFDDFVVYDCSKKPSLTESPVTARLKTLHYDQYLDEFDYIYDTFSREAVIKGRFDNYVKSDTAKRGTQTPDKEFVASLDKWRTYLAVDLARSNLKLTEEELNFAVQLIIDRLIFLRFCEDRGVETYGQLKGAVSKGNAFENLQEVFSRADDRYNSGLFDQKKDKVTPSLKVTNKVMRNIVEDLYYPNSQYDFKALPVEVLGNAYEQFLGKVIRIGRAHNAVIEEKPEVRKAGGVYYTPQYIVDYIVEHTVGNLITGKTPKEIEKIKIVDPACGSGSFLLGAFQYLLNYHQEYYHKHPPSARSGIITPNGTLSTAEKKKILLNNIYGVDLDANAVEVSKLSLLLKCMEGETEASIKTQITMFRERVLPDLDNNIKDGNSLIDTDIYDMELDFGEEKKIKPFSWKREFPEVFKQGGFDAVIGNPPYVRSQYIEEKVKQYFFEHYSAASYQPDTFAFFIEKGIKLLSKEGKLGFIIPNGLLTNTQYAKLRRFILEDASIDIIVDLKSGVFNNASVDTSIIVLDSRTPIKGHKLYIGECQAKKLGVVKSPTSEILQQKILELNNTPFNTSISDQSFKLTAKVLNSSLPLSDLVTIKNGMKVRKEFISDKKLDSRYKKFLRGGDIKPFSVDYSGKWVCYDKSLESLHSNQAFREEIIFKTKPKLLVRQVLGKGKIYTSIDDSGFYCDQSVYLLLPNNDSDCYFLLGLLNSKLLYHYFQKTQSDRKETFPKIKGDQLAALPIRRNEKIESEISKIVKQSIRSQEEDSNLAEKSNSGLTSRLEENLNARVYELYNLTAKEIDDVETNSK